MGGMYSPGAGVARADGRARRPGSLVLPHASSPHDPVRGGVLLPPARLKNIGLPLARVAYYDAGPASPAWRMDRDSDPGIPINTWVFKTDSFNRAVRADRSLARHAGARECAGAWLGWHVLGKLALLPNLHRSTLSKFESKRS
jgi:hypothetical protein